MTAAVLPLKFLRLKGSKDVKIQKLFLAATLLQMIQFTQESSDLACIYILPSSIRGDNKVNSSHFTVLTIL